MVSINMFEAKTTLSQLVARALAGEDIAIGKYGKPLVKLTPIPQPDVVDALLNTGTTDLSTDAIMAMTRDAPPSHSPRIRPL